MLKNFKGMLVVGVAALAMIGCGENTDVPLLPASNPSTVSELVAVTNTGRLIRFRTDSPGSLIINKQMTGGINGQQPTGIDYRPQDIKLYGIGANGFMYTIDTTTAIVSQVNPNSTVIGKTPLGFTHNPVNDRFRISFGDNSQLEANIDGSVASNDAAFTYAAGDANAGKTPYIPALAYTNPVNNPNSTTLFGLDSNQRTVVRIGGVNLNPSPAGGILTTMGPLLNQVASVAGFAVDPRGGLAYAAYDAGGGGPHLFQIDLGGGSAQDLGGIQSFNEPITGLSVKPN